MWIAYKEQHFLSTEDKTAVVLKLTYLLSLARAVSRLVVVVRAVVSSYGGDD